MEDLSLLHREKIDFQKAPNFGKFFEWSWSHQKLTHANIHLIRMETLPRNQFELTGSDLYYVV